MGQTDLFLRNISKAGNLLETFLGTANSIAFPSDYYYKKMCDHLCILIFMSSYHSYFFLLFSGYFRRRENKYVQLIYLLFNFYSFAVTDFSTMYLAHIFKNVICTSYLKMQIC